VRLLSLLRNRDFEVILGASGALSQIARWPDGAQAIIDAKILNYGLDLLESPDPYIRGWTCRLVGTLASQKSTVPAVLESNLLVPLVSLLRDHDVGTRTCAIFAFRAISQWPDGATVLANIGAFEGLEELCHDQSLDVDERIRVRTILDNHARGRGRVP